MRNYIIVITIIIHGYIHGNIIGSINQDIDFKQMTKVERLALFQIQAERLKVIETSALVQKYLEHPYVRDILFYNNFQDGFNDFIGRFNGLQELLTREDAGIEVVKSYGLRDPLTIPSDFTAAQRGKYSYDFAFLEMLLVQPTILTQLRGKESELLELVYNKYLKKIQYNREVRYLYSFPTNRHNILFMAHLLNQTNYYDFISFKENNNDYAILLNQHMIDIMDDIMAEEILSMVRKYLGL